MIVANFVLKCEWQLGEHETKHTHTYSNTCVQMYMHLLELPSQQIKL